MPLPELSDTAGDVKLPLESVTVPLREVEPSFTEAVTMRFSAYGSEVSSGVTVTVADLGACVTVTLAVPDAESYVEELDVSGVYRAVSVTDPAAREFAGMVTVADPALSVVAEDE